MATGIFKTITKVTLKIDNSDKYNEWINYYVHHDQQDVSFFYFKVELKPDMHHSIIRFFSLDSWTSETKTTKPQKDF